MTPPSDYTLRDLADGILREGRVPLAAALLDADPRALWNAAACPDDRLWWLWRVGSRRDLVRALCELARCALDHAPECPELPHDVVRWATDWARGRRDDGAEISRAGWAARDVDWGPLGTYGYTAKAAAAYATAAIDAPDSDRARVITLESCIHAVLDCAAAVLIAADTGGPVHSRGGTPLPEPIARHLAAAIGRAYAPPTLAALLAAVEGR